MAKAEKVVSKVQAPEGLARVGATSNAPWFELKAGNVCDGRLINVFERKDDRSKTGKSKFFQIELLSPAEVREGKGDDAEIRTASPGEVINLNYGPSTKILETYIDNIMQGAKYRIWCHVTGPKFSIGKGKTMWPIEVRAGQTSPPRLTEEPDFSDGSEPSDDSSSDDGEE